MRSSHYLLLASILALPFSAMAEDYTFEYTPLEVAETEMDADIAAPVAQAVEAAPVVAADETLIVAVQSDEIYGPVKPDAVEEMAFVSALDASAVADDTLGDSRGAFSPDLLNLNNSYLNANSGNNTNIGGVTGNNLINNGSFTNTQGLVNVIQNSGNNVVIQSSTIVNMTMIGN